MASAEAFKQLVELGYVAPPGPNVQDTVAECVRELKYNLARSYRDGNCCGEAAALAEELWTRWPQEHRFGLLLIDWLCRWGGGAAPGRHGGAGPSHRTVSGRGQGGTRPAHRAAPPRKNRARHRTNEKRRARFEERRWQELAHGRPLLLEWLFVSQALLEQRPAEARHHLEKLMTADLANNGLSQRVAGALAELGDLEAAQKLLEKSLGSDPENPVVHSQLADIHLQSRTI